MSQAQPTGEFNPQTPTPVEIWYPMQVKPQTAIAEVMAKATHHQRGVGFSTAPEMRLVTQSKLRLFRTSGTRASGGVTAVEASPLITSGAVIEPSI